MKAEGPERATVCGCARGRQGARRRGVGDRPGPGPAPARTCPALKTPPPAPPPPAVRALARQHGGGGGRPSAGSASAASAAAARGVVGQRARGGARLPAEAHPQGVHVGPDPPEGEPAAAARARAPHAAAAP